MYFLQGRDQYYRHDQYDDALRMLLLAWRTYRQVNWLSSVTRCWHMLGMIQTKRRRWSAAEFYFRKARERYEQADEKSFVVQVLHAWALIPYEFENWGLALARLKQAYATALEFGDQVPHIWGDGIQDDIKDVEQKLLV
jgi:tetratricopeptide (TPR) repeat protein